MTSETSLTLFFVHPRGGGWIGLVTQICHERGLFISFGCTLDTSVKLYVFFIDMYVNFLFAYLTRTGSRPKAQSLNLFPFPLRHNLQGLEVGLGDWECELGGLSLLQLEKLR